MIESNDINNATSQGAKSFTDGLPPALSYLRRQCGATLTQERGHDLVLGCVIAGKWTSEPCLRLSLSNERSLPTSSSCYTVQDMLLLILVFQTANRHLLVKVETSSPQRQAPSLAPPPYTPQHEHQSHTQRRGNPAATPVRSKPHHSTCSATVKWLKDTTGRQIRDLKHGYQDLRNSVRRIGHKSVCPGHTWRGERRRDWVRVSQSRTLGKRMC
jgi:hypothetical protein